LSAMQISGKGQETLTPWTHFQEALSAMQVTRKGQETLTI